ncbi:MAG: low molecular weight protein arginine phosphatase [Clostridia bacterium]|nr:low molecular weight protein arginine phosphatase [Clostridia bacterium]
MTENELLLCPDKTDDNKKKLLLFVCTGNTCRSPMAAALFNHIFTDSEYFAASAGLYADGSPISPNAAEALMERGVLPTPHNDYRRHVSRRLDEKLLDEADTVVAITERHAMEIIFRYPAYASRVVVMSEDIPDPYGGSMEVYRECLSKIEAVLRDSFEAAPSKESENG